MTACHLVWGHQSFRTNFLHLYSREKLAVCFSESVGTKWTDKMPHSTPKKIPTCLNSY